MTELAQRLARLIRERGGWLDAVSDKGIEEDAEEIKRSLWHDAQGDDLPEIDREVIVLCDFGFGGYKVCFAHRPNPKGWNGRSISTGMVDHYTPQAYGKGGWNIPNVKWWLDCFIPEPNS